MRKVKLGKGLRGCGLVLVARWGGGEGRRKDISWFGREFLRNGGH